MIRRSSIAVLRIVAAGVAVFAVSLGLLLGRLSAGPIGLPGLKGYIESDLSQARGGRPVKIGGVELAWPRRGMMQLRATDLRVLDSHGGVLTRSKDMVVGLSFRALLEGRVRITDAILNGGDVTITSRRDGSTTLAFGPPGSPPDIILPPSPETITMRERIGRLLDGLRDTLKPVGPGGRLNTMSVRGARLTVIDENGGGRWIGADAAFDLKRAGRALNIHASASLTGARGPAPFALNLTTDTTFDSAAIDLTVRGARPQALGPFAPHGVLAGLSAPVTLTVKAAIDRKQGLTLLDGDLTLGRGVLDYGGGRLALDGGRLRGLYDVAHDTLLVRELSLAGAKTKLTGDARLVHASALFTDKAPQPAAFTISSPIITFDMPGAFSGPVTIGKFAVAGDLRADAINVTRFEGDLEGAHINLKGRIYWANDAKGVTRPGVQAAGAVAGAVSSQTLLRVWPLHLVEGARSWLGDELLDGRIHELTVSADIKPADFAAYEASGIRDGALSVKFNYDHAAVRYIDQMTPITSAVGGAELKGNSFRLSMSSGAIGDLAVGKGQVILPRIFPKGALATYAGHVDGNARSMVNLLRQAPIGLDARLPFDPTTITGRGGVDFTIQRPLQNGLPDDATLFKFDAKLDNTGGVAKTAKFTISQWKLHAFGDQQTLTFAGPLALGKSHGDLTWIEKLRGEPVSPSTITMKGKLDAQDIVSLGFPVLDYARGPVGVDFKAKGKGADANSGQVNLDFRDASITLPKGFWIKPVGQAANVKFDLSRARDNSLTLNNLIASGAAMSATGTAHVAESGDLLDASSPHMVLGGALDGRVSAKRDASGVLIVNVVGPFLNIGPFFAPDPASADPNAPGSAIKPGKLSPAFEIDALSARVRMRADADLASAKVVAGSDGKAMTKFFLDGADPAGKPFSLSIAPMAGQPSGKLTLRSQDAGFAMRAITSQTNIKGGTVEADGAWQFSANPSAQIQLHMHDFRLVRVPAMASLLGSVASLTGMVDMLNGEGIQFGALDAPMTIANNQLTLGECRAAGPAIGLTAKGGVNLSDGRLSIDGVIVPSYGLNSMLGGLPIIGNLMVSRKGEGVFGLTYSLTGPADKPNVGVNPLSAFTPGIFRRIFEPLSKTKK